jgi:hypothetical protein
LEGADGQNQQSALVLVWRQTSKGWETDAYRIEPESYWYRVFKRTEEWDFEFAPAAATLAIAKQVCEAHAMRQP